MASALLRRGVLGLIDQGFSGLSNVLMVVMVARSLSAQDFGAFALSYTTLTFLLTASRSFFGTQLTLSPARDAALANARAAVGAVLILSPLLAGVVLVVSTTLAGTAHLGIALVVAAAAPVVCMQDVLRYAAVSIERPVAALISDAAWTVAMAVPVLGRFDLRAGTTLGLWLAAAVAALLICYAALGVTPDVPAGWRLARGRHVVAQAVTTGALAISGTGLAVAALTSQFLGLPAVGSLRGASTLMGPLNVVFAFVTLNLTPTLARRARDRDLDFCLRVAVVVSAGVAAWSAVLILLPDSIGVHLLHKTWYGAHRLLPWTAVEYWGLGVASSAMLWLRVRHRARAMLRRSLTYAAALMLLAGSAALVAPAVWMVAAAAAGAALVNAGVGWYQVLHHTSDAIEPAGRESPDADGASAADAIVPTALPSPATGANME